MPVGQVESHSRSWLRMATDVGAVYSGLSESLKLTVAIPLLWGVPPAWELLRYAL